VELSIDKFAAGPPRRVQDMLLRSFAPPHPPNGLSLGATFGLTCEDDAVYLGPKVSTFSMSACRILQV
jgi:hypothetical protein